MDNFDILNNIEDAIFVVNNENKLLFQNNISKKLFTTLDNFNKIKKYFHFSVCLVDTEDISNTTPIDLMLQSKENFFAYCSYQKNKDEYLQFTISSLNNDGQKILLFKDITNAEKISEIEEKNNILSKKYNQLSAENKKYSELKETASDQALKMALLNRISSVIRESGEVSTIIKSSIEEIHNLLGSFKTYYASFKSNSFKIVHITPQKYKNELNEKIGFNEESTTAIKSKEITYRTCIKEHENSLTTLSKNTKRIIIPVFNKSKLIGIIVSLTTQKSNLKDNIEILESISTQLSSSIIQASLFEEINKKNFKLQKTVNQLKETQLQLINSEKMASLGQLIAGIAHEINTPLASINSNCHLREKIINNLKIIDENFIVTTKELSDIDKEAIKRIDNMVKSLKKFVRLDEAELQEANINNELDLTLQLIAHETKHKIEIIKKYSKLPTIKCYPNMLNQVFMNILINACHGISENKIDGKITITTNYKDKNLYVSIKDNGIGIKNEIQNKIFTPGFTTKQSGVGTGLGLSISEKIIQKHKGNITFKSVEGKGTEFVIKIPSLI